MRIQTITDGPTSEYKYDEDTNRVIKRRPQGETFYVNQFYVDAAGRNSKHVFAGTTRISTKLEMPSNGGGGFEKFQYFYHPDHLGSTSYVTDQLGQVDQHYETFPFGESWIEEATGQADKVTPYRFTGKEWDSEVQLYYFGARYYDPRTSLWTAMDPALGEYLAQSAAGGLKRPQNFTLASYVYQNPLRLHDPDGRVPVETVWDVANAAFGYASARQNYKEGNYFAAALDGVGALVATAAAATPYVPGGASAVILGVRTGDWTFSAIRGVKAAENATDASSAAKADDFFKGSEFYRGAKPGEAPSMVPMDKEFRVDPDTGFVKDTHGVSVFDNPDSVRAKGFDPYRIDQSSIPDSLQIKQRGKDPRHFEVMPKPGANLKPQEYKNACSSIVCTKD